MKLLAALCVSSLVLLPSAFPQGGLTPPAAPAPTMKTLDQLEPRKEVNTTNTPGDSVNQFIISQSGSYYLAGNIIGVAGKHGIAITSENVTLDLNGFLLIGAGGSFNGRVANGKNLAIRNGTVRNWSFGIHAQNTINSLFEALRLSDNSSTGLTAGNGATVNNCVATGNGTLGFYMGGDHYVMTNCAATFNQTGLSGSSGGAITHCVFSSNGGIGILLGESSTITDCALLSNGSHAIYLDGDGCVIRHNAIRNSGGAGIRVETNDNHIEDNVIEMNSKGLSLLGKGNVVAGNVVKTNVDNYEIVVGNQLSILLSQIPESIDWPASVKLAGTLVGSSGQNGITVTSDDVTIDLDGHALIGVANSLDGIKVSGSHKNLVVRNGIVRAWASDGVDAGACSDGRFEHLELTDNTFGNGLLCGDRAIVTDCTARDNGSNGIFGGIICAIHHCVVAGNAAVGIVVSETGLIEGSVLNNNAGGGIFVGNWSVVRENTLDFHTTNPAILVNGMRNRIEGNHLTRNQRGIRVTGTANSILRNSASGSTGPGPAPAPNYDIAAGNDLGPVGTAASATSPWANLSF